MLTLVRQLPSSHRFALIAGTVLLSFFAGWSVRVARDAAATFDEPGFMVAGYSYVTTGAAPIATTNLRLAQYWLAQPLALLRPELPEAARKPGPLIVRQDVNLGLAFLSDPRNDSRQMLRASRGAITVLGVALGAFLFWCSRRMHGNAAGLVTLAFFCLNPVVVSNSALATTDVATALGFSVAVWSFWRLLHRITLGSVLLCGVSAGALAATKLSAILLVPMAVVMLGLRLCSREPVQVGWWGGASGFTPRSRLTILAGAISVAVVIAFTTIWAIYGFRYAAGTPLQPDSAAVAPQSHALGQRAIEWARAHQLLPEAFLIDAREFLLRDTGRRSFLLGSYSVDGWWYYFPVAWFFKTPPPLHIALLLAAAMAVRAWLGRAKAGAGAENDLHAMTPWAVLAVVYSVAAIAGSLNIGIRHLLPVYPFLFLAAGGIARLPWGGESTRALLVAGLLLWSGFDAWRALPYPLSYFNAFAGGSEPGHRVLVDSSYDWGQDLPAVERWLAGRAARPGSKPPVYFSYFGINDPRRSKIEATLLPGYYEHRAVEAYGLQPGTYVVSATMLRSVYGWAFGPWRPSLEAAFQELTREMQRLEAHMADRASFERVLESEGRANWARKIRIYDHLRFGRLCAWLRTREPTDRITPAMLVYELSAQDLAAALVGPPAELREGEAIKGVSRLRPEHIDFIP